LKRQLIKKKKKIKKPFSVITNIKKLFAAAQPLSKRHHMPFEVVWTFIDSLDVNLALAYWQCGRK
jgi:hypothetical protein